MTCHRRYYFEHPAEWTEGGHDRILATLQHACEINWWFNEPTVEGEPFQRLSFSFTASGRDQWAVHRRATGLAVECYRAVGRSPVQVPVPMWEALEPHMNRGRWRVPSPTASE